MRAAKSMNTAVGAVYLLRRHPRPLPRRLRGANILALNGADNVLHLASALLLLGVGLAADKTVDARARVA